MRRFCYNSSIQVISGLAREIPSPNGRAIRGAIQTDAAINAGNLELLDFNFDFMKAGWFLI